jgi:meso-butanediol dehydrogenase/(S,S)-butanediol dehydrogenase/diacetyl reductase
VIVTGAGSGIGAATAQRFASAVNLDDVFHGCRAAILELIKTGGSIVNVSSVSGMGGDWALSF